MFKLPIGSPPCVFSFFLVVFLVLLLYQRRTLNALRDLPLASGQSASAAARVAPSLPSSSSSPGGPASASRLSAAVAMNAGAPAAAQLLLFATPRSDGFNNQLLSLYSAARCARRLGRTLVLPPMFENVRYDTQRAGPFPFSDYFNVSALRPYVPVTSPQELRHWGFPCATLHHHGAPPNKRGGKKDANLHPLLLMYRDEVGLALKYEAHLYAPDAAPSEHSDESYSSKLDAPQPSNNNSNAQSLNLAAASSRALKTATATEAKTRQQLQCIDESYCVGEPPDDLGPYSRYAVGGQGFDIRTSATFRSLRASFRPRDEIASLAAAWAAAMGGRYNALHVRRGDYDNKCKSMPAECAAFGPNAFFQSADHLRSRVRTLLREPNLPLFVSTTHDADVRRMLGELDVRLFFARELPVAQRFAWMRSRTDVLALASQIVCSGAAQFIANRFSSYSSEVHNMRFLAGVNDTRLFF